MNSENCAISDCFKDLAIAMEIQGEQWRSSSYLKAAEELLNLNENISRIYHSGRIRDIKGVGPSIAAKIEEYFVTGTIQNLEDVQDILPEDMHFFRRLPLTLRETADVCIFADVHSAADLLLALEEGVIGSIPGLGEDVEQKIKTFIAWLGEQATAIPYCKVKQSAENVLNYILKDPWTLKAEEAGPCRRKNETAAAFTILVASSADRAVPLFAMCPELQELTHANSTAATGKTVSGAAAMLKAMDASLIPFEQLRMTGPPEHVAFLEQQAAALGLTLTPESMPGVQSEQDIYEYLGINYIPPEFREGGEASLYLNGDLRVRSTAADGSLVLNELIATAEALNYQYLCVVDRLAGRMTPELMRERNLLLEKADSQVDLLKGIEVDISVTGTLSAPDDLLQSADLVIAAVNSQLASTSMTERLSKALNDARVDVWGHPLNRLIGIRQTPDLDFAKLFSLAAEKGIALEINSAPYRSDLDYSTLCKVYEPEAVYSIGTDAACPTHLSRIELGRIAAEKAKLSERRVLNTLTSSEIRDKAWRDRND